MIVNKHAILNWLKSSSVVKITIVISLTVAALLLTCVAIKMVAPFAIAGGFLLWVFSNHNTASNKQGEVNQQEKDHWTMELYAQVARCILPILKEYHTALGINPVTVNSIYSEEKCEFIPDLYEPVLVYTIERKSSSGFELSDIKSAIQKRFNQEGLWLYVMHIDQRDINYLKFYILPIRSENSKNYAMWHMKNQFNGTKPQNPENRRDKEF